MIDDIQELGYTGMGEEALKNISYLISANDWIISHRLGIQHPLERIIGLIEDRGREDENNRQFLRRLGLIE